ncbi:MAG: hypothetical protein G01um101416_87 [Microgenomates group bacterium Gr01-1014_16]|nr:MAG: hypothetical protein G01um101416_87 [Microgenomates group bacterium Gr01-1014_16]
MQLADITTQYRGKLIIGSYKKWLKPGESVLDVGCGNGVISDILRWHFNLSLVGCDIASYLTRNIQFVKMTNETRLPFKAKQFDVVMFNDALHHTEFSYQEQLLEEGLRVGRQILIFELIPTRITKLFDWAINMFHYWKMQIPFTYRTEAQWEEVFKRLGLKYTRVEVSRPWLYPFSHQVYCLNKFNFSSGKKNHSK